MGKTGQFAEKQTAAVQSAGFEKFKTVMSKVNSVINLVSVWLFRLRKFIMAAPVVYAAIRLASYNGQHLPETHILFLLFRRYNIQRSCQMFRLLSVL